MNTILSLIILLSQDTLRQDNIMSTAITILEHLDELPNMKIKTLAQLSFTSTNSIIKFCQLLGFNTYSEFKQHLVSNKKTREEQLHTKCLNLSKSEIYLKMKPFIVAEYDFNELDRTIDQFIDLIDKYKCIHFYGAVFPLTLLSSFLEDMAIMSIPIYVHQMIPRKLEVEKNNGLNVIVTLTGRFFEINSLGFEQVCNNLNNIVLISKQNYYHLHIFKHILLPKTVSSDYDDIIYLLLLDLIKYKYYQKRFK